MEEEEDGLNGGCGGLYLVVIIVLMRALMS